MMYLVQQFRDGELRQSEALAAFSWHHHIPETDSSVAKRRIRFAQSNLTSYIKDKKNRKNM